MRDREGVVTALTRIMPIIIYTKEIELNKNVKAVTERIANHGILRLFMEFLRNEKYHPR